jgi:hypothetical protein
MTCACSTRTGRSWPPAGSPTGLAGVGELHALVATHVLDPAQVAVGIETDRGLLVGALLAAGFQVYAVNPHTMSRYRGRHGSSRAKSDRGDAKVLADLVRTDRHNHRPIAGDSSLAEAVKVLARAHQSLIWARQRHVNALRSALREFYPGALAALGAQLAEPEALAVLALAPTPGAGPAAHESSDPSGWSAGVGAATCRHGWWRSTTRFRRRSLPPPRQSRRPTARWSAP